MSNPVVNEEQVANGEPVVNDKDLYEKFSNWWDIQPEGFADNYTIEKLCDENGESISCIDAILFTPFSKSLVDQKDITKFSKLSFEDRIIMVFTKERSQINPITNQKFEPIDILKKILGSRSAVIQRELSVVLIVLFKIILGTALVTAATAATVATSGTVLSLSFYITKSQMVCILEFFLGNIEKNNEINKKRKLVKNTFRFKGGEGEETLISIGDVKLTKVYLSKDDMIKKIEDMIKTVENMIENIENMIDKTQDMIYEQDNLKIQKDILQYDLTKLQYESNEDIEKNRTETEKTAETIHKQFAKKFVRAVTNIAIENATNAINKIRLQSTAGKKTRNRRQPKRKQKKSKKIKKNCECSCRIKKI